ncbi:unnamed protein product, partial [marine sediment metagenome]
GVLYSVRSTKASDLRTDIKKYKDEGGSTTDQSRLEKRWEGIGLLDTLTVVSGGLGLAAAGAGLFLYLTGDDPGRYDVQSSADLEEGSGAGALSWLTSVAWAPTGITLT